MMDSSFDRYLGPGMMGGSAYGWMTGQAGTSGCWAGPRARLVADAPRPRISTAQAARLGDQAPADAQVNRAADTITFTTRTVRLVALAGRSMPAENFKIAGLINPTIIVPAGAHVTIELINADDDMAHRLVIAAAGAASSKMPMMTAAEELRDEIGLEILRLCVVNL